MQPRVEQTPREGEAVAAFFCRVPAGLMAENMLEPIAPQDALASFGITHLLRVDAEDAPEAMASLVDRAGGAFQVLRLPPMAADGRVVGEAAVLDFVAANGWSSNGLNKHAVRRWPRCHCSCAKVQIDSGSSAR